MRGNGELRTAAQGTLREESSCGDTQLLFLRRPLRDLLPGTGLRGGTSHCPLALILFFFFFDS